MIVLETIAVRREGSIPSLGKKQRYYMKHIETHKELIKLHKRNITCVLKGKSIRGKIFVSNNTGNGFGGEVVYVCQNYFGGRAIIEESPNPLGFMYSWNISGLNNKYETEHRGCKEIYLVDPQLEFDF